MQVPFPYHSDCIAWEPSQDASAAPGSRFPSALWPGAANPANETNGGHALCGSLTSTAVTGARTPGCLCSCSRPEYIRIIRTASSGALSCAAGCPWTVCPVCPLDVLTSQVEVPLEYVQRAVPHQHPQRVNVAAIPQHPKRKGAAEPVWRAGCDPSPAPEVYEHRLNAVHSKRPSLCPMEAVRCRSPRL